MLAKAHGHLVRVQDLEVAAGVHLSDSEVDRVRTDINRRDDVTTRLKGRVIPVFGAVGWNIHALMSLLIVGQLA